MGGSLKKIAAKRKNTNSSAKAKTTDNFFRLVRFKFSFFFNLKVPKCEIIYLFDSRPG